mmetsp:Transcript_47311/g.147935  ORF Transcript_47311/g.147935 Transcript_47311/m.147935 type:complete len:310 (-) Transcript_47311:1481-2410(-)
MESASKNLFLMLGTKNKKKKYFDGNLLLINFELELSAEKFECEFKIKNVSFFRKFIDSEWSIFYEKLDSIVFSGCIVVLSSQSIGDLATQYFSERNMLCGGRIEITILEKISSITKANIIPSVYEISKNSIGFFRIIEEKQISSEKYIFINSYTSKTLTLIIRGGNDNLIKDTIRSVNDGLMVIKHIYHTNKFVGGAGSCEMKLSEKLRKYAKTLTGTDQYIVSKLSKVFEIIPKTLIENSGMDPLEIIAKLRKLNSSSEKWYGVELSRGNIIDSLANFVWEPLSMKMNIIKTALGTCDLIINTDNTIV